jgi:hypothetical protein
MKISLFLFFTITLPAWGLTFETVWSDQLVKELHVTCRAEDSLCLDLCGASSFCVIEEKTCRSCIGTALPIQRILTELGRSIRFQSKLSSLEPIKALIESGRFVAISARDAFNVIDGFDSISVFRKFESLCPGESDYQLLFIEVDGVSRKIKKPRFIFCQFERLGDFFELQNGPSKIRKEALI